MRMDSVRNPMFERLADGRRMLAGLFCTTDAGIIPVRKSFTGR